jgi:hypothetical protein
MVTRIPVLFYYTESYYFVSVLQLLIFYVFTAISICCYSKCLISFTSRDTSCLYVCILRPGGSQKSFVLSFALKGPAESLSLSLFRDLLNMLYEPIEDRSSSALCIKIQFISHRKQTPALL